MNEPPITLPVDSVMSYHYWQDRDMAEMHNLGIRIIADSGAYSAKTLGSDIDPNKFYTWVEKWADHFSWAAALDVIGDTQATWDNWNKAPKDLHLVPTVHYGEPTSTLDRYADNGATLIALGGMVIRRSEAQRLLRWAVAMFNHAATKHPQVRFHGWGVTNPTLLNNLPFWSVDSSGFTAAYRYARMRLFDEQTGKYVTVALDGKQGPAKRDLLRRYNMPWQTALNSTPENRRMLVRAGLSALQRQAKWLQNRHHVTPPAHIKEPAPEGPLVAGVDGYRPHWFYIQPQEQQ